MSTTFLITTQIGESTQHRLWNGVTPLALGHPFKWIIERTGDQVRIRNISAPQMSIQSKSALKQISFKDILQKGAELLLPETSIDARKQTPVKLKIRQTSVPAPAFAATAISETAPVRVFFCLNDWVLSTFQLDEQSPEYCAKIGDQEVFKIKKSGTQFELSGQKTGTVARQTLCSTPITIGQYTWRFSAAEAPELAGGTHSSWKELLAMGKDPESIFFRKAIQGVMTGLAILMGTAAVMPKPKPQEELIPAQLAKLIMTAPRAVSEPQGGAAASSNAAPKSAQKTAVVQAFRAKALSNAVSSLLKGGMTSLLAQSDFAAGTRNSAEASKVFNSKNGSLSAAPSTAGMAANGVQVAGVGGGGGGGAGVGYGKGSQAGVKGQGMGTIQVDLPGTDVAEGLTKDQVGEVIHRHMSEVRYCYESAMIRTPDLEGKLLMAFTINGIGAVRTAEVKSSTLADPRLDDCILRRLLTWKFPQPKGGVDVSVSYPFIFKTLGR